MPIISLIAAIDQSYGLGKNNKLLCHLPADLQYFKDITLNKPIIMGRKTFDSIGRPLPQRLNIVISSKENVHPLVSTVQSIEEALKMTAEYTEVMIIGGATIYEQTLPIANKMYLTHIQHDFDADVFFPKIDLNQWNVVSETIKEPDESTIYGLKFCIYTRK